MKARLALIAAIRLGVHAFALVGLWLCPPTWSRLLVFAVAYVVGMLGVTVGYHRYFAHRSFVLPRWAQLLLALVATSTLQRGVIWWAAIHRLHHAHSDTERDPHSPRFGGMWRAHLGWLTEPDNLSVSTDHVRDLTRFPELRALELGYPVVALGWAGLCALAGVWLQGVDPGLDPLSMLVWGFGLRTVAVWHVTFAINSVAHGYGSQAYDTRDDSRNNALLALAAMGEGWHNNHHRAPRAASCGHVWYELDVSTLLIRALALVGVASAVQEVPAKVLASRNRGRVGGG